jgi:hypothetical protein
LPFLETKNFIFETLDPNFKGAVFRYRSVIAYTNQYYKKNFTLEILDESLLTNEFVFYFAKNFYLVDEINDKISQFKSNGLIDCLMKKYFVKDKKGKDPPAGLKFKQLSGIFELLVYGWISATCVMLVEVFVNFIRRIQRKKV